MADRYPIVLHSPRAVLTVWGDRLPLPDPMRHVVQVKQDFAGNRLPPIYEAVGDTAPDERMALAHLNAEALSRVSRLTLDELGAPIHGETRPLTHNERIWWAYTNIWKPEEHPYWKDREPSLDDHEAAHWGGPDWIDPGYRTDWDTDRFHTDRQDERRRA